MDDTCFCNFIIRNVLNVLKKLTLGGALVDVRKSYQKLFDSAAAMKSEFSDLNDKLFVCRMVSKCYKSIILVMNLFIMMFYYYWLR